MKINVIKDKSGKTIATFETATGNGPQVAPVLTDGRKVEPAEFAESSLSAIYA